MKLKQRNRTKPPLRADVVAQLDAIEAARQAYDLAAEYDARARAAGERLPWEAPAKRAELAHLVAGLHRMCPAAVPDDLAELIADPHHEPDPRPVLPPPPPPRARRDRGALELLVEGVERSWAEYDRLHRDRRSGEAELRRDARRQLRDACLLLATECSGLVPRGLRPLLRDESAEVPAYPA